MPLALSFGDYLGCPILDKKSKKADFKTVLDKINSKLAGWKNKILPMVGRSTLIKSVNCTIPAYVMQNSMLPISVHKAIDKANRDFLWGSTAEARKIHAVGWEKVTKPTELGGLGIKTSLEANTVAMAKLNWRVNVEDRIWSRVLLSKYKHRSIAYNRPSPTWRGLTKGEHVYNSGTKVAIRSGINTSFWYLNWTGLGPLRSLISGPLLRDEANLTVREVWGITDWDLSKISFSLPFSILSHILLIQPQRLDPQSDITVWNSSPYGTFSSKSAWLLTRNFACTPPFDNWTWIWKIKANPRIRNFFWLAAQNRLKTKNLLFSRNISQNDLCEICNADSETTTHVLRDCHVAASVWEGVGIPNSALPFFLSPLPFWLKLNCETKILHQSGIPWRIVFPFTCWNIWLLRNKTLFQNEPHRARDHLNSTIASSIALAVEWNHIAIPALEPRKRITVLVKWCPPSTPSFKLNTDAWCMQKGAFTSHNRWLNPR
ncbi:hypothetical protein RHMOL_Rhmol08G0061000 [Rhododendron molle]|uniref:Uncharacterized protein n=1 Tax=Rhododendron molle TaxID=49168 RepID=A0ACC0MLP5_RHOML|nr:hypothetical protein RHMOL_Rhmol08G0061000 [Rhododendron molle]